MNCPECRTKLDHATYEDVRVLHCATCGGYLVESDRLVLIKSRRDQSQADLQNEVPSPSALEKDSQADVRCPKCLQTVMRRQRVPTDNADEFHLDVCRRCDVVWFEGGELARMQLKFEKSAQAIDAFARQQRAARLDSDDDDQFERDLAALPAESGPLSSAVGGVIQAVASVVLVVASLLLAGFGFSTAAAICSLLAAVLLVRIAMVRAPASFRWTAIGLFVAAETLFLVWLAFSGA